jgi:hypothetical protein
MQAIYSSQGKKLPTTLLLLNTDEVQNGLLVAMMLCLPLHMGYGKDAWSYFRFNRDKVPITESSI